jgi:FkbM family methyltransferase
MKLEFDYVTHQIGGRPVTFAIPRGANDSYSAALRQRHDGEAFLHYILRRAARAGRRLKIADFGSSLGVVSLPLATHGMQVLSIEALPLNFATLAAGARAGGLRNLRPVNMAVAEGAGLATVSGFSAWGGARIKDEAGTTACDTLVSILEIYDFTDVDLIKLDVEGAELPALTGADEFFAVHDDTEVIFESNNHTCHNFGYDRQDLMRRFEGLGFATYAFVRDGLMPVRSDDPQPVPVVDILATRRGADALERQGEKVVPFTDDYVSEQLLRISTDRHPHIRKHFVTEAGRVGAGVKRSVHWPKISAALGEQQSA